MDISQLNDEVARMKTKIEELLDAAVERDREKEVAAAERDRKQQVLEIILQRLAAHVHTIDLERLEKFKRNTIRRYLEKVKKELEYDVATGGRVLEWSIDERRPEIEHWLRIAGLMSEEYARRLVAPYSPVRPGFDEVIKRAEDLIGDRYEVLYENPRAFAELLALPEYKRERDFWGVDWLFKYCWGKTIDEFL
ncbi:MAG: hypothetical protein M1827_002562 [Pycnora praestabilis]|nr:MAG: hypothetical protein M1827_002562 [Pycnora praestabilis]